MLNLSKLIEFDRIMYGLKVNDERHVNYLDREKRVKELKDFAEKVSYTDLSESDRRRYYDGIESSLKNLGVHDSGSANNPKKTTCLPKDALIAAMLISGGVCFGLGWKANDVYEELLGEIRRKDVEDIADYVEERLRSNGG